MEERRHSSTLFTAAAPNNYPSQLFDLLADSPDIVDFLLDCDGVVYSPGTEPEVACAETFIPFKLANTIAQTVAAGTSLDNNPNEQGCYKTTITPCTKRDLYLEWDNITASFKSSIEKKRWLNAFTPVVYQNLSQKTQAKLCFISSAQDALDNCFEHNGYPGATFDRAYYAYLQQLLQIENTLGSNPDKDGWYKKIEALIDVTYSKLSLTHNKTTAVLDAAMRMYEPANQDYDEIVLNELPSQYQLLARQALIQINRIKRLLTAPLEEPMDVIKAKAQMARLENIIKFNVFTLAEGRKDITLADYQRREMSQADINALEATSNAKTNQSKGIKAKAVIDKTNTKLIKCLANMKTILKVAQSLIEPETHRKAKAYQPTMNDKKGQVLDCLEEKNKLHPEEDMVEIFIDDDKRHCDAVASIKPEEVYVGITLYVYRYAPEHPELRDFIQIGEKIVGAKPRKTTSASLITENLEPNLSSTPSEGVVCRTLLNYLARTDKSANSFPTYLLDAIASTLPAHQPDQPNQPTPAQYNEIFYQKLIEAAVKNPEEALAETALLDTMTDVARKLNFTPLFYPLGAEVARLKTYEVELAARESNTSEENGRTTIATTQPVSYSFSPPGDNA
jgi:hypothetical protein